LLKLQLTHIVWHGTNMQLCAVQVVLQFINYSLCMHKHRDDCTLYLANWKVFCCNCTVCNFKAQNYSSSSMWSNASGAHQAIQQRNIIYEEAVFQALQWQKLSWTLMLQCELLFYGTWGGRFCH